MKINPVSDSLYKNNCSDILSVRGNTVLGSDVPIGKPSPAQISNDLFEKGGEDTPKEVAFKGSLGSALGVFTGELAALGATKIFTLPNCVLWPVVIVTVASTSFGLLCNYIEDKILSKRENEKEVVVD